MPDDGISIEMTGLKEIQDKLDSLTKEAGERAIRKALKAGAEIERAAIAEAAPLKQSKGGTLPLGALKNDIIYQIRRAPDGSLMAVISPGKLTKWVAQLVEYGHRIVTGGRARQLPNGKTSGPGRQVGEVEPHPFIRPAYEATRQAVADAICTTLATEVTAAAKRNKQ